MQRNRILRALPPAEAAAIAPQLETVRLRSSETIREPGEPLRHIYFPVGTMLSMMTVLRDGSAVEFATVGCDGVFGEPWIGVIPEVGRVICRVAGEAFRIRSRAFAERARSMPKLRDLVARYNHYRYSVTAQLVACNSLHTVAERCARWLLVARDCLGRDEFDITQEIVSETLGVRRAGVSLAVRKLQDSGAIKYRRGRITIMRPKVLARLSCECYGDLREIRTALSVEPC
jgi:CRP-like cAMP-binding protein